MKKIKVCSLLGMLVCFFLFCLVAKDTRAAVNADGSVPITEENFPDERFRCLAARYDTDNNNILSLKERSVLKHLYINYINPVYYQDTTDYDLVEPLFPDVRPEIETLSWRSGRESQQTLSVKGIEYFPELKSYSVNAYDKTRGSLKKNAKLKEICINDDGRGRDDPWFCRWTDCSRLEQDFPMKQLKVLEIGSGFECSDFSLKKAVNLEELRIGVTDSYYIARSSKLGKVDLTANKKLKKLWFQSVSVKSLDLRKNTKIQKVKIVGDRYYYDYDKDMVRKMYASAANACTLKLPKNNSLKELVYMTKNENLDLTSCKKLSFLQVYSGVELKFNSNWYKTYAKKKLTLYTRGVKTKKSIQRKTKKYVYIKTKTYPTDYDISGEDQPFTHG
ncbi:MAG: hypothetical protein HFG34_08650 [Eubacterium sp.]|nr:hypothetical protein [Eubacterium sp.]